MSRQILAPFFSYIIKQLSILKYMTREIKFKIWDKTYKKWLENFTVYQYGNVASNSEWLDSQTIEKCQYTGAKDKKENEIYEGDIVKNNDEIWDIYYSEGAWKMGRNGKRTNNDHLLLLEPKHSEVIGNIYENPELLA